MFLYSPQVSLLAIFFAAAAQNALCAKYLRIASPTRRFSATGLSMIIAFVGLFTWKYIFKDDAFDGVCSIIAYVLGDGLGTFIGLIPERAKPPEPPLAAGIP